MLILQCFDISDFTVGTVKREAQNVSGKTDPQVVF